jgi:CubicO group peptidase (beta-lactamase class C family)
MLRFAAAVLDPNSPIAAALVTTLSVRKETGSDQAEQALGWQVVHPAPGRELLAHGGGTGGYRSQLVIDPANGRAVIALTNAAAEPSVGDIAMRVLLGSPIGPTPPVMPPPPAAETRTEVQLPASELDRVVGRYEIAGRVFTFTREGDHLWAEPDGLPRARAYAEAPLQFFWRGIDVQIRFTTDESGAVTGGVFTQAGQQVPVRKLEP